MWKGRKKCHSQSDHQQAEISMRIQSILSQQQNERQPWAFDLLYQIRDHFRLLTSPLRIHWEVYSEHTKTILYQNWQYVRIIMNSPAEELLLFSISLVIACLIVISPLAGKIICTNSAFGDGLTEEQLTASLGNRKADLLIKMNPFVVTTETLEKGEKPTIEFRLFDSNTNQSFSHVTYYIIVEKDGKRLLYDLFHDHNGDLRIQVNPSNSSNITISGDKTPLLGVWIGTSTNPVAISGPIFLSGGLYHLIVRIETTDSDNGVLPDNQQTIYDSWLSIGNTENKQIDIEGKQVPIKIISYYDKLRNFGFDNKSMQMKFDMPFNWNLSRLNKTNIFVHEEISVPKPNAFTAKNGYTWTVNGIDITKSVALDNSNPHTDVIHIMLPKNNLISLADQIKKNGQSSSGLMRFILQPGMGSVAGSKASMGSMSNTS